MTWCFDMAKAPKDNTLLQLLIRHDDGDDCGGGFDDAALTRTMGFNNFVNDEIDEWKFPGWDWCGDCITEQGCGKPVAWALMLPNPEEPEGLLAGGEQVRAKASHIPTPEGQGGGEREEAMALAARIVEEYTMYDFGMSPANELKLARALLSSPRVEEVRREALEKCAEQFYFYAREHAVKADRALSAGKHDDARSSAAKAKVNADFAAMCKAALSLQVG